VIWKTIATVTLVATLVSEGTVWLLRLSGGAPNMPRPEVYAPVFLAEAILLVAMLERRAPLFGRVFWKGTAGARAVAITFDDGPTEPHTARILDILRAKGARATFFVLGRRAEALPAIVARIAADGHEVGNHGYDHSVLPLRGQAFTRRQIDRASAGIERACGRRPALFRPSHGWRNPWVNREAARAGCATIGWTLGVWDTDRPGAEAIRQRVARGVEPGCILLLHDGRGLEPDADASQVVEALPAIIDGLRRDGYRLVTVSELMKASAEGAE
jgi:peptidoglycan-N-acetylglucosamine deacetylase